MKAVFISYNQAYHEEILEILLVSGQRGYTYWEEVKGRGSSDGEPHLGDHAWPTLNSAMLVFAEDSVVPGMKKLLRELDEKSPAMGLRCFSWNVDAD